MCKILIYHEYINRAFTVVLMQVLNSIQIEGTSKGIYRIYFYLFFYLHNKKQQQLLVFHFQIKKNNKN